MALIKVISKLWKAPSKKSSRFMANNLDAAGHGRRLQNWQPSSDSINSIIFNNIETIRSRSRNAVLNNPTAFNAIESIVANCVGTGIKPQSKAPDSNFREDVQQLWLEWKDEADAYGVTDFYGLQSLVCQSMLEGGSCFIRLRVRKPQDNLSVPLQLQALEAEHLNRTVNGILSNGNIAKCGIEFDSIGQRVAYHLYKEHPGEQTITKNFESVRIPASEILHIFRPLRLGQIDGLPWLSRVLLKLHELDQYDDAELVRKKTAALFAAFVTRLDPEANIMGEEEVNAEGMSIAELEPGTVQMLEPGEDIKFSEPSDVGSSYDTFMRQQLRFVAMGMGISYEQLTGDLAQVNYSSIRAGLIEFRRKCEMLQRHTIIFQFCRPVWKRWIELALLSGALTVSDNNKRYHSVKWIPQGWEWVDPLKDQQAQQMAVRNGFKSRSAVVSGLGYDAEEIDQEIASDNERADNFGLAYDSDGRQPENPN